MRRAQQRQKIIYKSYERHYSEVAEKVTALLERLIRDLGIDPDERFEICVSGSGRHGLCRACRHSIRTGGLRNPHCDPSPCPGRRCGDRAGRRGRENPVSHRQRTPAASPPAPAWNAYERLVRGRNRRVYRPDGDAPRHHAEELNAQAEKHEKIYTVASRCGFSRNRTSSPLLNQGARVSDIAASILYAVVNQTIAGACAGTQNRGQRRISRRAADLFCPSCAAVLTRCSA